MGAKNILSVIDIGTGTIKFLVASKGKKEGEPEVLKMHQVPSSGIRKGTVINCDELSNILHLGLEEFQGALGKRVNSAIINISGSHIFAAPSRGVIAVSRADSKISQEDIERVLQASQAFSLPSNKEILDIITKEFIIDGERGIKEPIGMYGIRLEAEILALCGFSPYIKNLTTAVLNAGIQIQDIFISPLASARAVLTPKQKELGAAILDIGAGTTGLAVFEEGELIQLNIFPVGSGHITNDVAVGLKCDIDTAERVKIEYGSCFLKGNKKEKVKRLEEEEPLIFSHKTLGRIIGARISEIFDLVNKELKKISRQGKLPGGIILTGGGAKLPKITDMARKELKLHAKLGYPKGISGLERNPAFSVAAGLVLEGMEPEEGRSFSMGNFPSKIKKIFKIFVP